jgi:hypothetical protein
MNSVISFLNNKYLVAAVCGLFVLSMVRKFAGR